jgi:hypothetical protein
MKSLIYDLLCEILTRLKDIQSRAARTETRLMKLADELQVNLRRKE